MQRPRREEFILDVRRSASNLRKPSVPVDSSVANGDAIASLIQRGDLWLTPKVVAQYHPDDFTSWPREQRDRLNRAVEQFRDVASHVSPQGPATIEQFKLGLARFQDLLDELGSMVLEEWRNAMDLVERQAEGWSAEVGWRTRRVPKQISESLLGAYEASQLLIYAEPNLYVLDPVARFVPGGQGSFDFAIQPSYYTTSLYRDDGGIWHVHLEVLNGVSQGKRVRWDKDAFRECIEQLKVLV